MSAHLSPEVLNALVDGELHDAELANANEHLAACIACSSECLSLSLLKRSVAAQRDRFPVPSATQQRITRLIAPAPPRQNTRYLCATAAALLIACTSAVFLARIGNRRAGDALAQDVYDRHIAILAANAPPQVLSSDRHTVKPWFQGKLPFSFNLPQSLPAGTTLDGANLTYISGHPVAQLLYSIGKHRVSVFVAQNSANLPVSTSDRFGFHVISARSSELSFVAVSDLEPEQSRELLSALQLAQQGQ